MRQIAIVLLVVVVIGGAFHSVRTEIGGGAPRVAAGVTLAGKDVGGYSEAELRAYLDSVGTKLSESPIQPRRDNVTKGIIPGLAGRQLDVEGTVVLTMAAAKSTAVDYCFEPLLPEPTPLDGAIYQGNPGKQQITLVVNVAWGNDELLEMLDIFDRHSVKTTFFLVGRWANKFPDLVKEIHQRGHEFGNHAYSDPHLPQLSEEKIREEITSTTRAIQKAAGEVLVPFFSPPYNDLNTKVIEVAASLSYQTVLCSLDTADWMRPGVDRIVRRIVHRAHNGAIVLMHPTEQTPAALEIIIPALKEKGYALVPLSVLLSPHLSINP